MLSLHRGIVLPAAVVLGLLLAPATATAVEVFFNGVQVTGLKNQSFEGCKVKFDANGNVRITAKGYTVKRMEQGSSAANPGTTASPGNVAKQYFLYSKATRPGYAQYDIDVYVNGKWVRKIRNNESQVVTDITKKLRPGRNVVQFAATKNYRGKSRLSTSSADFIEVFIGLGNKGGGTVNITTTLARFKATAGTTKNFGEEQAITVR